MLRWQWSRVADRGLDWASFCRAVAALPAGQLWRHNEAGDLPGVGDGLDVAQLQRLVWANLGRRGFTFTHKPLPTDRERRAVHNANLLGFTINLSADSLEDADRLAELGIAPVAVVLPAGAEPGTRTPAGRHVVICPAQTAALTCAECQLCSVATRKAIVGFRAHGQWKARVTQLVQLRRRRASQEETAA
jgi:hypothetical protein